MLSTNSRLHPSNGHGILFPRCLHERRERQMSHNSEIDYGPLKHLIGVWRSGLGVDIAPEPEGQENNPYFETITYTLMGGVTNAERQFLGAIHYRQIVQRIVSAIAHFGLSRISNYFLSIVAVCRCTVSAVVPHRALRLDASFHEPTCRLPKKGPAGAGPSWWARF